MDVSGAAYADDQLGGAWASQQNRIHSVRIRRVSKPTQSISNLLGREHAYAIAGSNKPEESLSSFAAVQGSTELAEAYDLDNLINDNEIAQIRSRNESLLSRLLSEFVFEDNARVRSFLEDHASTSDFLLEAVPFLKRSFGHETILQLQIPPDEEVPLTIYAVALWDGTLEDARAALNNFDDAWWTANGHRALGRVVIDYQLV